MTDPVLDEAAQLKADAETALDRLIADARRATERSESTRAWALLTMTKTDAPTDHMLAAAALRLADLEVVGRG